MARAQAHLRIRGRVQGVFYRATACDKARELGLSGWVRNLSDGSVEAVACGEHLPARGVGRSGSDQHTVHVEEHAQRRQRFGC